MKFICIFTSQDSFNRIRAKYPSAIIEKDDEGYKCIAISDEDHVKFERMMEVAEALKARN